MPEWKVGLVQALAISAYVTSIAVLMNRVSLYFVGRPQQPVAMGVTFLLIFAVSALVCGLLSLSHPVKLALDKKVQEALEVAAWTAIFLMVFVTLVITVMMVTGT